MPLHTGSIKYTATDTEPASTQGNTYYDLSEQRMKHYDGVAWRSVNSSLNYDRPGDGHYDSDDYTVLLLKSDNVNGYTTFTDSGKNTHALTRNSAPHHRTAQNRIGQSSIFFDGVDDTITTPDHADWDLSTSTSSPFTIDCWVWHDSAHTTTSAGIVRARAASGGSWLGWELKYNLEKMSSDMIQNIKRQYKQTV